MPWNPWGHGALWNFSMAAVISPGESHRSRCAPRSPNSAPGSSPTPGPLSSTRWYYCLTGGERH
eukprot:10297213-Alexandrium_andersonii.AAC.1